MRLVFAGTPAFAAVALNALHSAGHEIVLVLTQPDRPAGRGMMPVASEVKRLAERFNLGVSQPVALAEPKIQSQLLAMGADAMVVAAYGLILPAAVLNLFAMGCINIHASLLPRWRGAAPIQRALLAGDRVTGISIMQMEQGLDTGPIFLAERLVIEDVDTFGSLHDKLAALGSRCIVHALEAISRGALLARPQPSEGASYAHKISKHEARLDWTKSATELDRAIRAFNPTPGAVCTLAGATVKIWRALPIQGIGGKAGEILAADEHAITVGCGEGSLQLLELQRPGGRRLQVADFQRGHAIKPGEHFDT